MGLLVVVEVMVGISEVPAVIDGIGAIFFPKSRVRKPAAENQP
jgi:hypothetical protein